VLSSGRKDAFLLNLVRVCGFVKHGRVQSGGFRLKLNLKSGTQTSILN